MGKSQLRLIFCGLGFASGSLAATLPSSGTNRKLFEDPKFAKLDCLSPLKKVENRRESDSLVGCQDAQGKFQGPVVAITLKGKKMAVRIYKDNEQTQEHTVTWDDFGKINFTEENGVKTFWYDFKRKKKHIETITVGERTETREWYPNGTLQSMMIEQPGLPPQVLGWDEKGKRQ